MGKENQSFKQVIQSYLEQRAKRDSLFATSFAKQNKNIDECCNYIIGEAKKRGGNAVFMSDDEVFGLAVHYYDEDDIKVSKQTNYKVSAGNVKKEASTEQPEIKKPASAPNKRKGMKNPTFVLNSIQREAKPFLGISTITSETPGFTP
ncbi:MAG: Cas9 inhibitor AcrIIA9 family protein [Bacteroides sp.]|uniref:PcfK-like family protein n=1 Tax=Bacteroides sp. TaxID=29523 RepID=UPI0029047089|nr:Cas9 inhibitor AcrIIA9 family protein [Bacteroides sp.]MDU1771641.1 Cas9 inhibitor AcrIIA9 family protein [Bacteroides sp.]